MGLNAYNRSALGVFKRSALGVKEGGAAPPEPGNILLLDVSGQTLVYSHTSGQWGILAPAGPAVLGVAWSGGVLYGYRFNQAYQYDPGTDAWLTYGTAFTPGDNIVDMVDWAGRPVVAVGFDIFEWTGAWSVVAVYSADGVASPEPGLQVILCDDPRLSPPEQQCVSGQEEPQCLGEGIKGMMVTGSHLYLGGDYWTNCPDPNYPEIDAHPIVDESNNVIAIFQQRVRRLERGPGNLFFVQLQLGAGDKPRWRDTWPGCCYYVASGTTHFDLIEAATTNSWVAVTAATGFDAANVIDYFGNASTVPDFVEDVRTINGVVYAACRYQSEQVIATTYENHGLSVGDEIQITGSDRYEGGFDTHVILEVPLPNTFVIAQQYRGSEACGYTRTVPATPALSGTVVSFAPRAGTPISGLYRWDTITEEFVPAFEDNVHPEGIPGAYPYLDENGPTYVASEDPIGRYAFDGSGDRGVYFISRSIPSGDGDSFERLDPATGLSRRFCFPELPALLNNPILRVQALPAGATVGQTTNICPGDTVTNKIFQADQPSIIITTAAPHGLTGAGRIVIENSTIADYDGIESIMEIVSSTAIRVVETFLGTASGDWYPEEDPDNGGTFTAVADGGLWNYWVVGITLGTDRRPGDIVIEGAQSGLSVDFSGVPYDNRERELIPGGVRGSRRVRRTSTATNHFYVLDYPQANDPGWVLGEVVNIRRP